MYVEEILCRAIEPSSVWFLKQIKFLKSEPCDSYKLDSYKKKKVWHTIV